MKNYFLNYRLFTLLVFLKSLLYTSALIRVAIRVNPLLHIALLSAYFRFYIFRVIWRRSLWRFFGF
jgi:hypothetical protein